MKNRFGSCSLALSLVLLSPHARLFAADAPPGFVALFNGKDLTGWWGGDLDKDPRKYMGLARAELKEKQQQSLADIQRNWRVENGELVNGGKGLYLTTDKFYGDFELLVDYRTVPLADSGIYLRGCPQVQIWDSTEEAKF